MIKVNHRMSNIFLDTIKRDDVSTESLNDTNDITRMAYMNDHRNIPVKTNEDRFENDIIINHKESFETNNSRINSLNEEILELKQKLKIIPEKDEKINKLSSEIDTLKTELEEYHRLKREMHFLKTENERFKQELIQKDNLILSLKEEKEIDKLKDLEEISESREEINKDIELEEKIKIDIVQLKDILYKRLKIYHEKHIEDLIHTYELNQKSEINKTTMQKLLLEAIHI